MVDRQARDEMVAVIESYINEEITAFKFDEALNKIGDETEDELVDSLVLWLWFIYDDITDHKIVADKSAWDFLQRSLLILKSDGDMQWSKQKKWTIRQLIAAASLIAVIFAVFYFGFTASVLVVNFILGGIFLGFLWWENEKRRKPEEAPAPDTPHAFPFESVAELLRVRKQATNFKKHKYPEHLLHRSIRSEANEIVMKAQSIVWSIPALAFYAPLLFLINLLPDKDSTYKIIYPASTAENSC